MNKCVFNLLGYKVNILEIERKLPSQFQYSSEHFVYIAREDICIPSLRPDAYFFTLIRDAYFTITYKRV